MQRPTDREACTALVYRFYRSLDTHDYAPLKDIFTANASMTRMGNGHAGLTAIRTALSKRAATLRTRHVISNLTIDPETNGAACGHLYMTVVRSHASPNATLPLLIRGPWRMSDVKIGFEHTDSGWRIATLSTTSLFEFDPSLPAEEVSA
ncbi:nuclear transport factor 2 family protein [Bordetella tumulicola]|uniref:nuclear transport factor 2 family protein n=1 Tax=Bordetella tumulicola TaxID=1649133 RepID=UPI0039F08130